MTRREEREQAFAIIFEKSFREDSLKDIVDDASAADAYVNSDYCERVVYGVFENLTEIDEIISANLTDWKIDRISRVALAVLRLALFEIKFMDDIPESVTVNEAVEIAKKFSVKDDAAYINGVLGSVIRGK